MGFDLETENPLEYTGYEEKLKICRKRQDFQKQLLQEKQRLTAGDGYRSL